jgi:hypothetical protein
MDHDFDRGWAQDLASSLPGWGEGFDSLLAKQKDLLARASHSMDAHCRRASLQG